MNIEEKEKLRQRLLNICDDHNITQHQLAKVIGTCGSTVSNYVSGKNIPPIDVIKILHKEFNLSYDYLLDGRAVGESELLEKWRKLSNNQQEALLKLIKTMI